MAVVAIIPARYGSTRFPGKPLATIEGKPMVQHVYESASKVSGLDRVLVATDDRRILEAVRGFGGEAVLTSRDHVSGTDRLAEVARKIKARWYVNVQGDLPFVRSQTISRTLKSLQRDHSIPMGTARTLKVVTDAHGFALYFSRAPIPYLRGHNGSNRKDKEKWGHRHLGIYVYRHDFLLRLSRLRPVTLERVRVIDVDEPSVEVDTPEDLKRAKSYLRRLRIRE
jgi:3-deoxy-manno-octulosonate cytidylyltransferase (CMP-KDO synthetase)